MALFKNFDFEGEHKITVLGNNDQPWFFGSQICDVLGYAEGQMRKKAIQRHVSENNKTSIREALLSGTPTVPNAFKSIRPFTVLINEMGLYELVFNSKAECATDFRKWIFSEVLPSIRKTGQYISRPINNQIEYESDLQKQFIKYYREKDYGIEYIVCASLGELQDTKEKRIDSHEMGYCKGMPDIMVYVANSQYNGLAIELKRPGYIDNLSVSQKRCHEILRQANWHVVVSDNLDLCKLSLDNNMSTMKLALKCPICNNNNKFRSPNTLTNHKKVIHRCEF